MTKGTSQIVTDTLQKKERYEAKVATKKENINIQEQKTEIKEPIVQMKYSGFWVRGAALIIDILVIGILVIIIAMPIGVMIGFVTMFSDSIIINSVGQILNILLGLAISWGYYVFMTYKFQATLGKMAVGAKVVDKEGQNLKLGKIVIRETIGKFVSGVIFGIGYIMAAFTGKKQALHDLIANSVVIYKDPQKGANKVVVAIVYVIYGLLTLVFMVLTILLIVAIDMAGVATYNSVPNVQNMQYNFDDTSGYIEDVEGVEKNLGNLEKMMEELPEIPSTEESFEVNH